MLVRRAAKQETSQVGIECVDGPIASLPHQLRQTSFPTIPTGDGHLRYAINKDQQLNKEKKDKA